MLQKGVKILVTHPEIPMAGLNVLKQDCIELIVCKSLPPKREEILQLCPGVDGILWASHEKLNAEVLDVAGPNLKAVSTMSAGLDFVDIDEFKKRKIPLGHTPGVLSEAVADIAIGLMIAASRRFVEGRRAIESSTWDDSSHQWLLGQDIVGSRVGFVGFGSIGKRIATRLNGFKVGKIMYSTRHIDPEEEQFKAVHLPLEALLKESDFVFIVCPLTEKTKGMFNRETFNIMKRNCVLINVARGPIVDQTALYEALKNGKIFAAGIDVMTPEPLAPDDPILSLPNCVITPHLGSATRGTRDNMAELAALNILRGIEGKPMMASAY